MTGQGQEKSLNLSLNTGDKDKYEKCSWYIVSNWECLINSFKCGNSIVIVPFNFKITFK